MPTYWCVECLRVQKREEVEHLSEILNFGKFRIWRTALWRTYVNVEKAGILKLNLEEPHGKRAVQREIWVPIQDLHLDQEDARPVAACTSSFFTENTKLSLLTLGERNSFLLQGSCKTNTLSGQNTGCWNGEECGVYSSSSCAVRWCSRVV